MRPLATRSVFILTVLLILGSSVYLGLRSTVSNPTPAGEPPAIEPLPYRVKTDVPTEDITLEEARSIARSEMFELPIPTYLPNGVSLAKVKNSKEPMGNSFRLIYSSMPEDLYAPDAKNITIDSGKIIGDPPDDEWFDSFIKYGVIVEVQGKTYTHPDNTRRDVRIRGIRAVGYDRFDISGTAFLFWWADGLEFHVEGAYPLDELIKTAESMVTAKPTDKVVEKITPIDDAHVAEGYPDKNFGGNTAIYVQSSTENYRNGRAFLKFDLSDIPPDSEIIHARLHLYCWKGRQGNMNMQVHSVETDGWAEMTITWNNQPLSGDVLDTVYLQSINAENEWHSWDVTKFVAGEFASDKIASLCLKAEMEGVSGQYAFESKEWGNTTLYPYLEITYIPPPHAVSVSVIHQDRSGISSPGTQLSYIVKITNKGRTADNYVLSVNDTLGWHPRIFPAYLTVPAGEGRFAMVNVTIPESVLLNVEDRINVRATSPTSLIVGSSSFKSILKAVDAEKIVPTDDAHIAEGYLDNNFGDRTALYLQSYTSNYKNERIYLKFDLAVIPSYSKITQAKLYLYCWSARHDSVNVQCYDIDDDAWSEVTITWNNQPSIGELLDAVLLNGTTAENNWHSWDVTKFVAGEFASDKIASLCLKAEMESVSGQYAFESKEWWETSLRPYLEIYTIKKEINGQ